VFIAGLEDRLGFGRGKHSGAGTGPATDGRGGVVAPPEPARL
jgi:hypothetical protein